MGPRATRSFLLLLAIAAGSVACRKPAEGDAAAPSETKDGAAATATPEVKKEAVFLSPVFVRTVRRGEMTATVAATGTIVPVQSIAVRTEEAGRLRFARPWIEGDSVAEGEIIARLESPSLLREEEHNRADIEIQRESMQLGERTLESRLREYRTLTDLYARGIAAEKEVDAAKLQLDQARNNQRQNAINLEKAQSRLQETLERIGSLEVTAPRAGLLVSRATLEGQGKFTTGFGREAIADYEGLQVSAGHAVCGVADTSRVMMRCDVTARDIGRVAVGADATATVYAREDMTIAGRISRISGSVNPDTRAFEVDVELDNAAGHLKPGMFGKAEVVTDRRRDSIALPRDAVTRRNNQDVVFIVEPPVDTDYSVARMKPVELGLEGRDDIEITFGVSDGDQVIMRGFEVLQDGTPVNAIDLDSPIRPETPTPVPTPAATPAEAAQEKKPEDGKQS